MLIWEKSLISGCFCPSGTVELDDKCIAPDECPFTNTTVLPEEVCPMGMVYNECGTACPTTCDNKDELVRPCTLQCVQGILSNYVLHAQGCRKQILCTCGKAHT